MNKVFVVTDGPSLREALAEADASDRVVVAEGAFLEPPALAVRDGRWVATWAPGTIHAAEGDPPATPPILEPATRDALAAKLATETTTAAGELLAAGVPGDELTAVARELWTARGMDGVGWITGVWTVHGGVRLAALAIDGEVGWAETRLSAPSASDPHGIRLALARCVDRLASRKLPRPPGSGDHGNRPPVLLADGRRAFRLHPDQVGPESLDVVATDPRRGDSPEPADASGAPGPAPGDSSPLPGRCS